MPKLKHYKIAASIPKSWGENSDGVLLILKKLLYSNLDKAGYVRANEFAKNYQDVDVSVAKGVIVLSCPCFLKPKND